MIDPDKAFYDSFKPSWATDDGDAPEVQSGMLVSVMESVISESKEVRFARFAIAPEKVRYFDTLPYRC